MAGAADLAHLAERIAAGSPEAETELVELLQERVRRLLTLLLYRRRIPQPDWAAQELAQETLWRAVLRIRHGKLQKSASVVSFVHGIAINVANEHSGKEKPLLRVAMDALPPASDPAPGPEARAIQTESSRWTLQLLRRLRPRDREVLIRFYLRGQSKEAICDELRLGSGQFDQIKSRALRRAKSVVEGGRGSIVRYMFAKR